MKISIITACYNSAETIEDTLKTIEMQSHQDIEHIVIDGGSTDGTLDILHKYQHRIAYLISEPDHGLYDAMNKGISKATGDIIGLLNSDDMFAHANVLSDVVTTLTNPSIDACYGDLVYVTPQQTNKVVRYWKSCEYSTKLFGQGWMPAHPTFYVRREVHEKHSILFNLDYKLAADYEVLFRLLYLHQIKTGYIPKVMVRMRLGGATNKSMQNVVHQNKEIIKTLNHYDYPFSTFIFLGKKMIDKVRQYQQRAEYVD